MRSIRLMSILAMLVLVVLAAVPQTSRAAGCACLFGGVTQEHWGSGASCSQAVSAAASPGYDEAAAGCYPDSVCLQTYVERTACYWDAAAGVYRASGVVRYRCYICS